MYPLFATTSPGEYRQGRRGKSYVGSALNRIIIKKKILIFYHYSKNQDAGELPLILQEQARQGQHRRRRGGGAAPLPRGGGGGGGVAAAAAAVAVAAAAISLRCTRVTRTLARTHPRRARNLQPAHPATTVRERDSGEHPRSPRGPAGGPIRDTFPTV